MAQAPADNMSPLPVHRRKISASSEKWRVLIFPGATEIALELRQALMHAKEVLLFAASQAVSNHGPFAFTRHYVTPSVMEDNWLECLTKIVRENGITHIFPAHDDALLALAERAAELGARLITSPLETCRIARSKSATMRHLECVVPVPALYRQYQDVVKFPVFLKPDRGQGSQRTALARNRTELTALLEMDPDRIILEHLPGREFTVDCFSDRDKGLLFASGRERVRIRSGIAMASVPCSGDALKECARRISSVLEFHGAWFCQFKQAHDGELKLLEVAPRIGGTSGVSRVGGVNLPLLSLYEAERIPITVPSISHQVELDRALVARYRHNIKYRAVYVDLDDTLVLREQVNADLIRILYQAANRGCKLVAVTRHAGDLTETLRKYRLTSLFDEVMLLRANEPKSGCIFDTPAVFIDDSFRERYEVSQCPGVTVLDVNAAEILADDRA